MLHIRSFLGQPQLACSEGGCSDGGFSEGQVEGPAALPFWAHFMPHIRSLGGQPQRDGAGWSLELTVPLGGAGGGLAVAVAVGGGAVGAAGGEGVVATGGTVGVGSVVAVGAMAAGARSTQPPLSHTRSPLQSVSLPQPGARARPPAPQPQTSEPSSTRTSARMR
jgi:hypothetical protein